MYTRSCKIHPATIGSAAGTVVKSCASLLNKKVRTQAYLMNLQGLTLLVWCLEVLGRLTLLRVKGLGAVPCVS